MRSTTASLLTAAVFVAAIFGYAKFTETPPAADHATMTPPATEMAAADDLTDAERQQFRDEVRAYLLDSPEVLMEAIQVLEGRQRQQEAQTDAQMISQNAPGIFEDGYSWVGGNPDGDITLVEFQDYRCSFCRKAHDEVNELVNSDGNIRLIIKEFPILGEQSVTGSRLAIAVFHKEGPEKYKELSDFLMSFNGNLSENTIKGILNRFEIEADPILAYMNGGEVLAQIAKTRQLGELLNVSGTPTFVLDTEMLRGYVPLARMREIVKAIRAERG